MTSWLRWWWRLSMRPTMHAAGAAWLYGFVLPNNPADVVELYGETAFLAHCLPVQCLHIHCLFAAISLPSHHLSPPLTASEWPISMPDREPLLGCLAATMAPETKSYDRRVELLKTLLKVEANSISNAPHNCERGAPQWHFLSPLPFVAGSQHRCRFLFCRPLLANMPVCHRSVPGQPAARDAAHLPEGAARLPQGANHSQGGVHTASITC